MRPEAGGRGPIIVLPKSDLALRPTAIALPGSGSMTRIAMALEVSAASAALREPDGRLRDTLKYEVLVVDPAKAKVRSRRPEGEGCDRGTGPETPKTHRPPHRARHQDSESILPAMFRLLRPSLSIIGVIVLMGEGRPAAGRPGEKVALVTVIAEAGTPIRELTGKDFIVKEDGKKREVLDARLATDQLAVALVLDVAQPPRGAALPTQELRTAATTFVRTIHAVNPDARIALWQFASAPIATVDFTNKTDDLASAISRLFPNQQSSAVLLEAVEAVGKQLAEKRTSRRAIVTVDFNSPEGSVDGMLQKAADSITNSGATLWAASVRPGPGSSANREELLDRMTKASGGKRYSASDALAIEGMLKKVAASLTSQYVVTFNHPGEGPARSTTFETVGGPKVLPTPFMR